MVTVGMLALISAIGIASTAVAVNTGRKNKIQQDAYNNYTQALNNSGLNDANYDLSSVLLRLEQDNVISTKDYREYLELIKDTDATLKDGMDNAEFFKNTFRSKKDIEKAAELYNILAENIPEIKNATYETINALPEDIKDSFLKSNTPFAQVARPIYEDVDFANYQREVKPVKLWTGQELADLHNIDYNPNTYYDLIKAGTEAQVDLANYKSAQMNNASMVDDTAKRVSYLDAIRNNKAEAIANGATLGARAANELLSNVNSINEYATNQKAVADERFKTVDEPLLNDAQAKLTARSYFDQLAQTLSGHSMQLYQNDTDRFGQDWLSNAEFYTADQNLRGQRAYANASMLASQAQANATINAANAAMKAQSDEYAWVFDRFLGANKGNVDAAVNDMDQYLFNRYTGKVDYMGYLLDNYVK